MLLTCTIWMIPVEGYVFNISFAFFSLRKLKANWWLELFKFFIHKYFGLFFSITQDLLTIFSIYQSHDGLFWIIFWLSYEMAVLYIGMRNVNVGRLKYLNNGMFKTFVPNIVRNSSYFNIISLVVLIHRIRRCFKNYDFVLQVYKSFLRVFVLNYFW